MLTCYAACCTCNACSAKLLAAEWSLRAPTVRQLQLNQPTVIEGVTVTALDANHCPGAIMLLFEVPTRQGAVKRILHTGDCRWVRGSLVGAAALSSLHVSRHVVCVPVVPVVGCFTPGELCSAAPSTGSLWCSQCSKVLEAALSCTSCVLFVRACIAGGRTGCTAAAAWHTSPLTPSCWTPPMHCPSTPSLPKRRQSA
jgi:hypothetical protein